MNLRIIMALWVSFLVTGVSHSAPVDTMYSEPITITNNSTSPIYFSLWYDQKLGFFVLSNDTKLTARGKIDAGQSLAIRYVKGYGYKITVGILEVDAPADTLTGYAWPSNAVLTYNQKCNGKEELCDRPYNRITQLMSHDSNSTRQGLTEGSINVLGHSFNLAQDFHITNPVADQNKVLADQLHDGVRAFKIPIHPVNDRPWAVHTLGSQDLDDVIKGIADKVPSWVPGKDKVKNEISDILHKDVWKIDFSNRPFIDVLNTIKKFLDDNKHEVVTLFVNFFDMDTDEWDDKVAQDVKASGLEKYLHVQDVFASWPTLRDMIKNNKRFVLFVDKKMQDQYRKNGFNYFFDFAFQSEYNFHTIDDLKKDNCSQAVKNKYHPAFENMHPGESLFQLQHFVTPVIAGDPDQANKANQYDVLMGRVEKCAKALQYNGKPMYPAYIMVDYYDVRFDDLKRAVDGINSKKSE